MSSFSKSKTAASTLESLSKFTPEHFSEMRRTFLMEHRQSVYYRLLTAGQLDAHLKAIGNVATTEMERQTAQLQALSPSADLLAVRTAAEKIVIDELICC